VAARPDAIDPWSSMTRIATAHCELMSNARNNTRSARRRHPTSSAHQVLLPSSRAGSPEVEAVSTDGSETGNHVRHVALPPPHTSAYLTFKSSRAADELLASSPGALGEGGADGGRTPPESPASGMQPAESRKGRTAGTSAHSKSSSENYGAAPRLLFGNSKTGARLEML
jgi:hypothetical protein